jgi:hypothetical protein
MKPNPDHSARWSVACILLLAAVLMTCMSSCIVYRGGDRPLLAAAGMNADEITLPGGATFKGINTADAFRDVVKQVRNMWQSYLVAEGLKFVSGLYYSHQGTIVNQATTVRLEELRNARDLDLAKLKLEELKLFPPQ